MVAIRQSRLFSIIFGMHTTYIFYERSIQNFILTASITQVINRKLIFQPIFAWELYAIVDRFR